ncbi:MAG: SDR family NAD(P)-dependent oxidoreductase [Clostridia bacterium]|nr:SDR family NAD(P)-dependent oxidoreductase [Clostridia bacterium]MDD4685796.1 SDR family NAD(P)-dependent oxidoreductase [Clostridia bacterium]
MIVIITGASSGIGLATANFLTEKGYKVYGLSRRLPENSKFENLSCDITDYDAVLQKLNYIFEKEGKIDVLINNAGMGIAGAIEHTENENIQKIFDLNILAVINCSKLVVPFMRAGGGGKIINISSVAGVIPIPFQTCYSVTKSAVDMFSMAFGLEVKDFKIQLTSIMPGDTKSSFVDNRVKNKLLEDENYKTRIESSIKKMEKDERKGMSPLCVSKVIYKTIRKKKSPSRITVGFNYKLIVFLSKILPRKFMLYVIKKIYG